MSDEREAAEEERAAPSSAPRPVPAREAIGIALAVTAATALVTSFAFDPARGGSAATLAAIGALYAVGTAIALVRLDRRGELYRVMRPASGDVTLGALVAGLLYGAAHLAERALAAHGTPQEGWVMRIYLQLGDPRAEGRVLLGGAIFVVAALEEITWRGLVMRAIDDWLGAASAPAQRRVASARAVVASSILFAVAHAPTLLLVRDPVAGLNPLVVLAAFGCGVVWAGLFVRAGRLVPAIFAHAFFSLAVVDFPIWRP